MLNETASSVEDRPSQRVSVRPSPQENARSAMQEELRQMVMTILTIERETFPNATDESEAGDALLMIGQNSRVIAVFEGVLTMDSKEAYDKIDALFAPHSYIPLFRVNPEGKHIVIAVTGRTRPQERPWWPNALLFVLTVFSVLLMGLAIAVGEIDFYDPALANQVIANGLTEIWRGLPYAISILLILGAHELGHYFAARRHKLAVTLPYFIPEPFFLSPFGTLGAFIQLRQPIRNRKALMDIGASGPLIGLLFAIPILIIGLLTSPVGPLPSEGTVEGNSLLYALLKTIRFGEFLPNGRVDVFLNQFAWAGWAGLLLTSINLIPIGQLDGGHIMYALLGERARKIYFPALAALGVLVLFTGLSWLLWLVLIFLFGRLYATPLDMITPLDRRRQMIGVLALIVFIVTFVPEPLQSYTSGGESIPNNSASLLLPVSIVLMQWWLRRRRR
jgi:Zn-dependent protease